MTEPDQTPESPTGPAPTNPPQEVVDQMRVELVSLAAAWHDRGVTPAQGAEFITFTGLEMVLQTGCSLGEVSMAAAKLWDTLGGKL